MEASRIKLHIGTYTSSRRSRAVCALGPVSMAAAALQDVMIPVSGPVSGHNRLLFQQQSVLTPDSRAFGFAADVEGLGRIFQQRHMQLNPADMMQGSSQQTAMQGSTNDEGWQVVQNKGSKQAPSTTTQAAGHAPSRPPNTGPASAAAAAAQRKLMAEAHKSLADPVSGRLRCRACGKAFSAYSFLAQHLKQRHFGLNSEDAKVLEYRHLEKQQQEDSRQSSSSAQLTAADFPSLGHTPAATAAPPASPSTTWGGWGANAQPPAATNGPSKDSSSSSNSSPVLQQKQPQPSTAAAMSQSSSTGRAAGKPRPLAAHSLDLGHLMELSSKKLQQQQQQYSPQCSPQQHKRRSDRQQQQDKKQRLTADQVRLILAAAAEQGLKVKHGAAELKRNSRHKLSRLKRLIIKERADRQLAAAGHAMQQATADAEQLQQQLSALQMRLEAAQQLQQLLAGSSCSAGAVPTGDNTNSSSSGPAQNSSACADSSSSSGVGILPLCCDPQVAARTSVAALELAVQRATSSLVQGRAEVSKRRTQQQAAQTAWNKAYKVPEDAPEASEAPEQQQQDPAAASQQQQPEQDTAGSSNSTSSTPGGEAAERAAAADTAAVAAAVPELPRWLSQVGSESESEDGDERCDVCSVSCGSSSEEEDDSSSDGEGLSGFVDVLSRWAANMPQQQLAQAFKVARRREAKAAAAAAAVTAGPVHPSAAPDAAPAAAGGSNAAAVAAAGVPKAAQQASGAASSSNGANSRAGLAAVCPAGTSAGLIDGSESSSGCDSSDDDDAGALLGWGKPLLPAVANKEQPQQGSAAGAASGAAAGTAAVAAAGTAAGSSAPSCTSQAPVSSIAAPQQQSQASTGQQQQQQGRSCAPLAAAVSQQPALDISSRSGMTSPTAQITQETPFGPASLAAAATAVAASRSLAASQQQQQPELRVLRVSSKQQDSQQVSSSHSSSSITALDPVMPTPMAAAHASSSLNSRSNRGRPLGGPQFERSMSSGRVLDRRHGSNNSSSSMSSYGHAMLQPPREDAASGLHYDPSWQQQQQRQQYQQQQQQLQSHHGAMPMQQQLGHQQQMCQQLPGMSAAAGKLKSSSAMHLGHMANTSQGFHYAGPTAAHVDSMDSSSSLSSAAAAAVLAALSASSPQSTLYGGSSIAGASSLAGGSLFGGSPFGGSPLGGASPLQGGSPSHLALSAAAANDMSCAGGMLGGLSLQQQYAEQQQQQLLLEASMLSQQQQQQQQQEDQDEQIMALQVAATVAAQHSDPAAAAAAAAAAMVSFKQQKQEKQQQELQQQQMLLALEQMSLVCGVNLDPSTSTVLAAALANGEIDAATLQQLLQLVLQPAVPANLATTSVTQAGMPYSSSGLPNVGLPTGGLPSGDLPTSAQGLSQGLGPWGPNAGWEAYSQASFGPTGHSSTPGNLNLDPNLYLDAAGFVGGPGQGGLASPHMGRGGNEGHYGQQQQVMQPPPPPPPRGGGPMLQQSNSMRGLQQQQQQQLNPYLCGLCQVPCNSLQTLQQHFESKRHITKAAYASLAAVQHSSSLQQQQQAHHQQQQQLQMPLNPAQLQGGGGNLGQQQQQPQQHLGAMPLAALSNAASSSSGSLLGRSFSPPAGALAGLSLAAEAGGGVDPCAILGHCQAYNNSFGSTAAAGAQSQQAQQDMRRSSSLRSNSSNMLPYPALTLGVNGNGTGQHLRGRSPTGRSPTAMSPTGTSYGHGARGNSPLGGSRGASPGGSPRGVTYVGPNAAVQAYCTQEISPELNTAVTSLLTAVKTQQDKAIAKNPGKAALKRYYVCGLREVCKAIKAGKAVAVLLAPNIEQNEAEGGLNDSVQDIITACSAADIPTVFALSRKKMGEVYGFRKRMSAIALLDVACVQETLCEVLQLAAAGRRAWAANNPERLAAAAAAVVASEVAVALGGSASGAGSTTGALAAAVAAAAVPTSCN